MKFRAKFEVLCTTYRKNNSQSLRITRSQTFFLPQTVPDSVEIREVYSAEIVSNLQKGSGKKTRLKSVLLKYCTEKDTQQDKGRHTRGD